jgi:hypothetical protein
VAVHQHILGLRLTTLTPAKKVMAPFIGDEIDDLLALVRSSSDRVRACAEGILDNIMVDTHQTTENIRNITQQTEGEVFELRGKIDEILQHQKDFQLTLDSISSKNSLLSFLREYLSKSELRRASEEPILTFSSRKGPVRADG